MDAAHDGLYLYCLARADAVPSKCELGIDTDPPLSFHTFRKITAVFREISLNDFCGESGNQKLGDPDWIGPRIIHHEEVIEAVMSCSPVIPARFGTIYSSPESLESFLVRNESRIMAFFEEISGKSEWAVKELLDRGLAKKKVSSDIIESESIHLSSLSSGRRYFEEKRLTAQADAALANWLGEVSKKVFNDLQPHVCLFRERKIPSPIGHNPAEVVTNWAFLVYKESLGKFKEQIFYENSLYKEKGLVFELSGPWPPYSFSPLLEME